MSHSAWQCVMCLVLCVTCYLLRARHVSTCFLWYVLTWSLFSCDLPFGKLMSLHRSLKSNLCCLFCASLPNDANYLHRKYNILVIKTYPGGIFLVACLYSFDHQIADGLTISWKLSRYYPTVLSFSTFRFLLLNISNLSSCNSLKFYGIDHVYHEQHSFSC